MEPIIFEEALLNGIKQDIPELQKRINNLHEEIEKSVTLGHDVDQHLVSERLHLTQLLEKKLKEKNELEDILNSKENQAGHPDNTTASPSPTGATDSSFNSTSPMMPNYIYQLVQTRQVLTSVLIAPYVQPLMDAQAVNSDISRQVLANHPMLADSPGLREQLINELPAMIEQMRNSEAQSLMQNRRARAAITKIQEGLKCLHIGLQSLHMAAPNLFQAGGLTAGLRFVPTGLASSAATATDSSTNFPSSSSTSTISTGQTPSSTTDTPSTPSSTDPSNYARVLAKVLNMIPNQNINLPLDQRYAVQLEQLNSSGFNNFVENIQALTATMEDANAAIERLFAEI